MPYGGPGHRSKCWWSEYRRSGEAPPYSRGPTIFSKPKAKLEIYQVLIISESTKNWCKVKNSKINGWIKKNHLWGIQKDEIIKK